ncbi:amidohydrolase family protein [Kribbella sp. NPDC056861]|uniref:amidohydrolase family protein n=1 Tax=Kribbella sp. NPDC056861 TaxID=3154857 RepID=UPI00342626B3
MPIATILEWTVVERMTFASDYPLDDPVEAFVALEKLGFTAEEIRRIGHDNAAELFGLGGVTASG